jgi:hypothetical protein
MIATASIKAMFEGAKCISNVDKTAFTAVGAGDYVTAGCLSIHFKFIYG